jgi:pseudouridine synthase
MRINKYVAQATGLGRRKADKLILEGKLTVNGERANLGHHVENGDIIKLGANIIELPKNHTTLILNKPVGYVCSRDGQGSRTIYDLIPEEFRQLKSIGRLDKDSSGILVLTDDGELSQKLSHPSFNKQKIYEVRLKRELTPEEKVKIETGQIRLDKKPSILKIKNIKNSSYQITLAEGRNRQIRRTFEKLNIEVSLLNRIQFGPHKLRDLKNQVWSKIN